VQYDADSANIYESRIQEHTYNTDKVERANMYNENYLTVFGYF